MVSKEDVARRVFETIDKNKAGVICKKEIIAALTPIDHHADSKISEYMGEYGKNSEDNITFEQFRDRLTEAPTKLNVAAQFLFMDKDGDHRVSLKEIEEYAAASGEEEDDVLEIKDEAKMIDADRDGYINYPEFATMIDNVKKG